MWEVISSGALFSRLLNNENNFCLGQSHEPIPKKNLCNLQKCAGKLLHFVLFLSVIGLNMTYLIIKPNAKRKEQMIKNFMLFYIFHVKREKTYSSKWFGPACFYLEILRRDPESKSKIFPYTIWNQLKSSPKCCCRSWSWCS